MQFGTMQTALEGDIFLLEKNIVTSATSAKVSIQPATSATSAKVSIQPAGAVTERRKNKTLLAAKQYYE